MPIGHSYPDHATSSKRERLEYFATELFNPAPSFYKRFRDPEHCALSKCLSVLQP